MRQEEEGAVDERMLVLCALMIYEVKCLVCTCRKRYQRAQRLQQANTTPVERITIESICMLYVGICVCFFFRDSYNFRWPLMASGGGGEKDNYEREKLHLPVYRHGFLVFKIGSLVCVLCVVWNAWHE